MPTPARRLRAPLAALLLALPLAPACGGAPPPDSAAAQIASIDQRLRGAFRLVRFDPEVPLEPMLAAMLEYQYTAMLIRFDGKRIVADSPGIHVDRAYEIREPQGDRFKLVSWDESGVPYESWCELVGEGELRVHSQTPPWKGVATIRRASPGLGAQPRGD